MTKQEEILKLDINKIIKGIDKRAKIALEALAKANRGKDAEIGYRLGGRYGN